MTCAKCEKEAQPNSNYCKNCAPKPGWQDRIEKK